MSAWTHNICAECYAVEQPDREPSRFKDAEEAPCCFCGRQNTNGIFYRADPSRTLCKGKGVVHD